VGAGDVSKKLSGVGRSDLETVLRNKRGSRDPQKNPDRGSKRKAKTGGLHNGFPFQGGGPPRKLPKKGKRKKAFSRGGTLALFKTRRVKEKLSKRSRVSDQGGK